ncbi:hypothetical protein [Parapedobacter indicus]|uniref:hypothetical protein n=1 Tax=Parapedobacter indicus TaxID=1477437 RepID=UPI0034E964D2
MRYACFGKSNQVDDNSDVGLQVIVEDVDGDGLPDIVVSNKKGVFFTRQVARKWTVNSYLW